MNDNQTGPVGVPRDTWARNQLLLRPGVEVLGEAYPIDYQIRTRPLGAFPEKKRPQRERMHPESTQSSPGLLSKSGFYAEERASRWLAPPQGTCSLSPPNGQRHQSPLWKATAHRSSKQEDGCRCLRWTQAGVEPGWQRKHLERHWEEGGRSEREERVRHANSSAFPPSNQNRIPSRPRPVSKEIGEEARVSGAMVRQ